MDSFMQSLASGLINSLRYLEKGIKETTSVEREKSIAHISKVMQLNMDLSQKIINGIFFSSLSLLGEKSIHESEIISLLNMFTLLFDNYSSKQYFLSQEGENLKLILFLLKLVLDRLKSDSKEIAIISSKMLKKLAVFLNESNLKQAFPSLCSETFKLILDVGPKTNTKLNISCLELLHTCFEKLFSDKSFKIKETNKSSLITTMTKNYFAPESKQKLNTEEMTEKFYFEAKKNIFGFFQSLKDKIHKYPDRASLQNKFVEIFELIFKKCHQFFIGKEKLFFDLYFDLYLAMLSETEKDTPLQIINNFPEFKHDIKAKQINILQNLPKLCNEVESSLFIQNFKRIILGFNILNQSQHTLFTSDEFDSIYNSLLRAFQINFKGKIVLNEAYNEFNPHNLTKVALTEEYLKDSSKSFDKKFNSFLTSYLPITNFEESVFEKSTEIFGCLGDNLTLNLANIVYTKLFENKFQRLEELLTHLLIFMLLIKKSQTKLRNINQIFVFFVNHPYENVGSNSKMRSKEQKLMIDLLCSQIAVASYQNIEEKNPTITTKIFVNLFTKFYQENFLLSNFIWISLIKIAKLNFTEISCFEDFMKLYSETLLRNFVDKLKIINILQNTELPFKLLSSFILFSDKLAILKSLDSILAHINHHFDKFYLKEDYKTLLLILPLYKIMFSVMDDCFKDELEASKKILPNANSIRKVLMRTKPFILDRDKYLSFYTIELFKISARTLSVLPMEKEENNINFSTEDPENVSIPESLGPVAYEFFEVLAFRIKSTEFPAMKFQSLLALKTIQEYNPKFLVTERRFELMILPSLNSFFQNIDKEYFNEIELKIIEVSLAIIEKIPLYEYGTTEQLKKEVGTFFDMCNKGIKYHAHAEKIGQISNLLKELIKRYEIEDDKENAE